MPANHTNCLVWNKGMPELMNNSRVTHPAALLRTHRPEPIRKSPFPTTGNSSSSGHSSNRSATEVNVKGQRRRLRSVKILGYWMNSSNKNIERKILNLNVVVKLQSNSHRGATSSLVYILSRGRVLQVYTSRGYGWLLVTIGPVKGPKCWFVWKSQYNVRHPEQ